MSNSRIPGPLGASATNTLSTYGMTGAQWASPGAIGAEDEPETLADKKQSTSNKELNIIAKYDKPKSWNATREYQQVKSDKWFPHTLDFRAVAGSGTTIENPEEFLLAIVQSPGAISRLNFFTHGAMAKVATTGEIAEDGSSVSLEECWTYVIGAKRLMDPYAKIWGDEGEESGTKTITVNERTFSLDDVRKKFTKDAEIWLYACNGGADLVFLQNVANTFQVVVKAFSVAVVYVVPNNFPTSRKHKLSLMTTTDMSKVIEAAVDEFHSLKADRTAIPIS